MLQLGCVVSNVHYRFSEEMTPLSGKKTWSSETISIHENLLALPTLGATVLVGFGWLSASHLDRRDPIPERPVPDGHSLQILLQPGFLTKFFSLAKRRGRNAKIV